MRQFHSLDRCAHEEDPRLSISVSLLERLRDRSADDWKRLLTLFSPVVYRWARRSGLQDSDAVDVVQDVFAAVHGGIVLFRKGRGQSFRGWLYGITRNKLYDFFRKAKRWPQGTGGSTALQCINEVPEKMMEEENEPEQTTKELARRGLELIRDDFEAVTWQAFQAFAVQGRPARDVADELGMSVGAVYVAKSRVLKRLREELEGLI